MARKNLPASLPYFVVPSLVLAVGIVASLLIAILFLHGAEARDRERLQLEADLAVSSLQERMEAQGALLRGAAGLFIGSEDVSAAEFRAYVGALGLGTRYPGILGIGFAAQGEGADGRRDIEARMQRQGFADYRIWPEGARPTYTGILYLEPMDARNEAAIGYDMSTEPRRRAAMQRAASTGLISTSAKVELVQEIDANKQPGFVMYLAVRPDNEVSGPPVGFVYSPLRAGDLMETVFPPRPDRMLDVAIYDGAATAANLLYDTRPAAKGLKTTRHLALGGRIWTLDFTATRAFAAGSQQGLAWVSGVAGLVITIALSLAVLAQARGAMEAERARGELRDVNASLEDRVEARTHELREEMGRREAAEDQVRQMQKMEAISQLSGGIAHDFNNMLAIVIGSLDMARRRLGEKADDRVRTYLNNAAEGAQRAALLTGRLLAFARRQQLRPEPLDPNTLVAGMTDLLQRALGERVQVVTVLDPDVWSVHVDAAELENALLNLAVNARDAMPEGGLVTLSTQNVPDEDQVAICVTDTGVGMTPEVLARAFEPFFTTKQVGRGTGLGLSQVYGFVHQSGGQVTVTSSPGEGASVTIRLPRWAGEAPREARAADAAPTERARADETVLVVEDEAAVRRVSVEALRELGYVIVEAGDAAQAMELLPGIARLDLLFTDVVMPGLNGFQLAERARAMRPGLRVLFTTGYAHGAGGEETVAPAMILAKPFAIDQLARKVREVLDAPASRAA